MLVKSPVLDRDNRLGQVPRKVLSGQFVALEDAAGRKGLAFGALNGHRALGRLNLKAAGDRQRGNGVEHKSAQQDECDGERD